MLRSLPTGGHSIPTRTIIRSFLGKRKEEPVFRKYFADKPILWVGSGTEALTLSLEAVSRGSSKKEVILPAYTCPSVLASVIKAGLRPVLCDLEAQSFRMDPVLLGARMGSDTLAVIAVHLFGIPTNILEISELATKQNVIVIEDAAQAFGNKIIPNSFLQNTDNLSLNTNQYLGSLGDIGILSFGRGKPLSFLAGGAVLINNTKYQEKCQSLYSSLSGFNHSPSTVSYVLNLLIYSIFYHPHLYWIPQSIPWLKLGETIFSLDFKVRRLNPLAFQIANELIKNFEKIQKIKNQVVEIYKDKLASMREEFVYFPESLGRNITLLRFPIIFKSNEKRDLILSELKERGLGATGMYPVPLNEQEGIPQNLFNHEFYPNAKHHSERIITLPLHEYVRKKDVDSIGLVISKHLSN